MRKRGATIWRTFRIPLLIGCVTLAGLIWALLVDGSTDWLAAVMVAAPIAALLLMKRLR